MYKKELLSVRSRVLMLDQMHIAKKPKNKRIDKALTTIQRSLLVNTSITTLEMEQGSILEWCSYKRQIMMMKKEKKLKKISNVFPET
ncbi:hypothetical protein E2C01_000078 [Portunus trituberculatus]|uniref:Uncharacterized protein n=1 Tax=Portunus trituberculatus TaxID=210409 RepID=A0A5B7CGB9_PORTR|nr:hypothetical protein [Portunus trituberculatus]